MNLARESLSYLVALGFVAGCTTAPEPATVRPVAVAASASSASPAASVAAVEMVAPPPVFPVPSVTIDRGTFTMGCPKTADTECEDDEKPAHQVELSPYEIDIYEVTAAHYKACMDAGACGLALTELDGLDQARARAAAVCREQFRGEQSKRPVVCVSMLQAQAYCEWRGKRLPTEAEWERAARGDSSKPDKGSRLYPWGDEPPTKERACVQVRERCDVGSHPRGISPYGLHDMVGNAAEWVWDYYDPEFYASSPQRDPDGSWELLPMQKRRCESKVCWTARGGSWQDFPLAQRATTRTPKSGDYIWQFTTFGFRCAKSTEPARRAYFANRVNIWNAKQAESSGK